jgi:hypothetical protein
MEWQQLVSLVIVASAAGLLAWSKVRRHKYSFERETLCGCAADSPASPHSSIIFRARKGERPEVRVRMR